MHETNIEERVRYIISECVDREPAEVTPEARLVDDLGADPVELAELSLALEAEFNLVMEDPACRFGSVGEVVDFVKSRLYE